MTQSSPITLSKSFSVFNQQGRILKPSSTNCGWLGITLPYNLDPGNRVKLVSSESRLSNEYFIVQNQYLAEIGVLLIRIDDSCNKNYSLVAFNMGNSTVTFSYGDNLGKAVHIC